MWWNCLSIDFTYPLDPIDWISNFTPHLIVGVNTYPCWNLSSSMLIKVVPDIYSQTNPCDHHEINQSSSLKNFYLTKQVVAWSDTIKSSILTISFKDHEMLLEPIIALCRMFIISNLATPKHLIFSTEYRVVFVLIEDETPFSLWP